MKLMDKVSLRMRITLLAGTILILCSVILTLAASYNAHSQITGLVSANIKPVKVIIIKNVTIKDLVPTGKTSAATTTATLTAAKKQFDKTSIIILAIVCILGTGLVYLVSGKSLRPIHDLSKTITEITEDNLQQRIPNESRSDEVGVLGHSFNVMLDRLEKSFLRQKRFSANVAHELRTPLATIKAGIQVLHLDENPSIIDYEETLASTESNVNRLMAVVTDLLNLCDEQEESYTDIIEIPNMFELISNELHPILEEKHIEIVLNYGLQTVRGNIVLFYRACFNLIENAAKYNKVGGKIIIETKVKDGEGQIVITDTGNGIPSDELQLIFEPFYRVNKSRSRKEGGAGLGLSIVKTIIEKHGFTISANSMLGQGSIFTIRVIA